MDSIENYEDSYALTQEFREWIVCLENKSDQISSSFLKFPNFLKENYNETDEVIEL